MTSEFDMALAGFSALNQQLGNVLGLWLLVFARVLAFIQYAPIVNRKDIFFLVKLVLALYLTCLLVWLVPPGTPRVTASTSAEFVLLLLKNVAVGALLGYVADLVMQAVNAAGDLMNNQMGLSSAMMFDPGARKQVSLFETFLAFIGAMVFLQVGGLHWVILAFQRSLHLFPLASLGHNVFDVLRPEYLAYLSGNVMKMAVLLIAPVMLVTMSVDLILGVMNRTAQQIPVFQLSMGLKPTVGVLVLLGTLGLFLTTLREYFIQAHRFF